jgi:(1->4)-alpha-D-glucan 1-alpha-D-glucosylmutase
VPDIYQGSELWDHRLVDPDNRRPVDYALRVRLLAETEGLTPEAALARSDEGLPKLWLTRRALELRRRAPQHFGADAAHVPLAASGTFERHVIAYRRGTDLIAIAQRLPLTRGGDWADTAVELPQGSFRDLLSTQVVTGGQAAIGALLSRFPVCLLERTGDR